MKFTIVAPEQTVALPLLFPSAYVDPSPAPDVSIVNEVCIGTLVVAISVNGWLVRVVPAHPAGRPWNFVVRKPVASIVPSPVLLIVYVPERPKLGDVQLVAPILIPTVEPTMLPCPSRRISPLVSPASMPTPFVAVQVPSVGAVIIAVPFVWKE